MANLTKLLDISVAALVAAADEYDVRVYEMTTRGRGTCVDVSLVDDNGATLVEVRVYEKTAQILNAGKWGTPYSPIRHSYEIFTPHHDSPKDFRAEMDKLVAFYVHRREGLTAQENAR